MTWPVLTSACAEMYLCTHNILTLSLHMHVPLQQSMKTHCHLPNVPRLMMGSVWLVKRGHYQSLSPRREKVKGGHYQSLPPHWKRAKGGRHQSLSPPREVKKDHQSLPPHRKRVKGGHHWSLSVPVSPQIHHYQHGRGKGDHWLYHHGITMTTFQIWAHRIPDRTPVWSQGIW